MSNTAPPRDLDTACDLLCPPPQRLEQLGPWTWPAAPRVFLGAGIPGDSLLVQRLLSVLGRDGRDARLVSDPDYATLVVRLGAVDLPPEGYRLRLGPTQGLLEAHDGPGAFHGVSTLSQWLRTHGEVEPDGSLPGIAVDDWPDLPHRGFMLDVSRNKVPQLSTLESLIDLLADCKINHLQLYTEHTFAYRGHEAVWQDASPLTPSDLRHLDAYCQERHIELVPNQNSFGHFHRWLVHEPYRRLAECPDGIEHPFSDEPEPFSLCPVDDRVLPLLQDLYDQLLPCFSSSMVNVGLDETLDLGQGRSAEACGDRGQENVYLDFLRSIHRDLQRRGHRMMYWGDVVLDHPQLIPHLPDDAVVLAWGYEANFPFDEKARRFAESGLEFWMCPGTSTWSSLAGRGHNALHNLANAALAGKRHGSPGMLITEWGDHGHLQPLPTLYLGALAGAAMAWNASAAERVDDLPVAEWLDLHAFRDDRGVLGGVALDLANAYLKTNAPPPGGKKINGSALFFQLAFVHKPEELRRGHGMTPEHLHATREHIADALARVPSTEGLVERELRWLADILDLACRLALGRFDIGPDQPLHHLPDALRRELDDELESLIESRRRLWMERNRPGGWELSAQKLERVRRLLWPETRRP